VRPGSCITPPAGEQPSTHSTHYITIKWIFLFRQDGGYGPDSWCFDDHPGDNDDAYYSLTSEDGGVTWTISSVGLSFKGVQWPVAYRMEVFDVTHPIIYMSASKHHEYFTRDNDHDDSVYSDWGCNDDVNGLGRRFLVDLQSLSSEGNNVGEPNDITTRTISGQDVTFNKKLSQRVDLAGGDVDVTIAVWDLDQSTLIWDEDEQDDQVDVSPGPGRELNLTVDLEAGTLSGDVSGICGRQLTSTGTSPGSAQVWFRVDLARTSGTMGSLSVALERARVLDQTWDRDGVPELYGIIATDQSCHPSPPFVNDLGKYYPEYFAWDGDAFYDVGPIKEKWLDHAFWLCD
jgi:hypothetical protein